MQGKSPSSKMLSCALWILLFTGGYPETYRTEGHHRGWSGRHFNQSAVNKVSRNVLKNISHTAIIKKIFGCRWVTGVPPGLQNLCWTLRAPWVSSILTGIRQTAMKLWIIFPQLFFYERELLSERLPAGRLLPQRLYASPTTLFHFLYDRSQAAEAF